MLDILKVKAIYEKAITDEKTLNDLIENPANLADSFDLTDADISEIISSLDVTLTNRELIEFIFQYNKTIKPLPRPWHDLR